MRGDHQVEPKFRPNPNYKREKGTGKGKRQDWRGRRKNVSGLDGSEEGRCALIIIALIGHEVMGHDIPLSRDFIKLRPLWNRTIAVLPWLPEWYKAKNPLSPKIVWDRLHKMYYDNGAPRYDRGRHSREHYMLDDKLRPFIPAVEKLYRTGKVITREQATAACSYHPVLQLER